MYLSTNSQELTEHTLEDTAKHNAEHTTKHTPEHTDEHNDMREHSTAKYNSTDREKQDNNQLIKQLKNNFLMINNTDHQQQETITNHQLPSQQHTTARHCRSNHKKYHIDHRTKLSTSVNPCTKYRLLSDSRDYVNSGTAVMPLIRSSSSGKCDLDESSAIHSAVAFKQSQSINLITTVDSEVLFSTNDTALVTQVNNTRQSGASTTGRHYSTDENYPLNGRWTSKCVDDVEDVSAMDDVSVSDDVSTVVDVNAAPVTCGHQVGRRRHQGWVSRILIATLTSLALFGAGNGHFKISINSICLQYSATNVLVAFDKYSPSKNFNVRRRKAKFIFLLEGAAKVHHGTTR